MNQAAVQPSQRPVLLIEDEPAVMAYVRAALERSGYPVVSTESGAEALKILQGGEFMGVVSDMRTPGGVDGAQVHAWITANRPDLASKIVFITGDLANDGAGVIGVDARRHRALAEQDLQRARERRARPWPAVPAHGERLQRGPPAWGHPLPGRRLRLLPPRCLPDP